MRWLQFAWRNTLRNKRRSLATLLVAALGTAALLLAGGFAIYTYQGLAQSAARSTGHLVLARAAQFQTEEEVPLQHGLDDWQRLRASLLAEPEVRQVLPRVEFAGLVSNGEKSAVMMAVGIDPEAEFAIKGPFLELRAGRLLERDQRFGVLLGEGLARSLHAGPGDGLTLLASTVDGALNAVDVQVRGVVSTGVAELDRRLLYTDVASAQKLLASERVSSLGVFLDRMESTAPLAARLAPRLQSLHPDLALRSWLEQASFYRSVKQLYDRIFGTLGSIIALIVVFVVASSMAMAVVERTREIGTLRALGTLPGQLQLSLALEGLLMGGAGALAGAALALGLGVLLLLVPIEMPPPPGYSRGYPLQIALDPALYGLTLLAMLLLSALASAWVARKTLRQPVVEALAHV